MKRRDFFFPWGSGKLEILKSTERRFFSIKPGSFSYLDIEPLAADCTEIMAWHTVTAAPRGMIYKLPQDEGLVNIMGLFKSMVASGLAMMDEELGNTLPMCIGAECVQ